MPWLIVIGKSDALKWILDKKCMAFRAHVKAEELNKGDRFAIYTSRGAYGNPTLDESQLLALGTIASPVRAITQDVAGETFAKSCAITIQDMLPLRHGVPFRVLIPQLKLIRSEREWPGVMHRTLVPIDEDDYATVAGAIRDAKRHQPGKTPPVARPQAESPSDVNVPNRQGPRRPRPRDNHP